MSSAGLRMKLALVAPSLSAASWRIVDHPSPAAFYPEYMMAMHGISRAAVPLLQAAASSVDRLAKSDPTAPRLREYLRTHTAEELGHDEWALEDLEAIGCDRKKLLHRVPSASIAALVGSQYYWIQHVHPVALMGYLAVMEANPPSLEAVERLREATGFPAAAFRSMRLHSHLDVAHRRDLYEVIDALPLVPWQERLVALSALRTAEMLVEALIELVDEFDCDDTRAYPSASDALSGTVRRETARS